MQKAAIWEGLRLYYLVMPFPHLSAYQSLRSIAAVMTVGGWHVVVTKNLRA